MRDDESDEIDDREYYDEMFKQHSAMPTHKKVGNIILLALLLVVVVYRPVMRWYQKPSGVVGLGLCQAEHVGFVSSWQPRKTGISSYTCIIEDDPYRGVYP